jgi:hypothetical protein
MQPQAVSLGTIHANRVHHPSGHAHLDQVKQSRLWRIEGVI